MKNYNFYFVANFLIASKKVLMISESIPCGKKQFKEEKNAV